MVGWVVVVWVVDSVVGAVVGLVVGAVVGLVVGAVVGAVVGVVVGLVVGAVVGVVVGCVVGAVVGAVVGVEVGSEVGVVEGAVDGCVCDPERFTSLITGKALPRSRPEKISMTVSSTAMPFIRVFMRVPRFRRLYMNLGKKSTDGELVNCMEKFDSCTFACNLFLFLGWR